MSRGYLSDFILRQKCVPWFIIARWRVLIAKWRALVVKFREFVQVQRFIETIDLEKIYGNTVESPGDSLEDMAVKTIVHLDEEDLIKNTRNVDFLKQFKDKTNVTDAEIKETVYCQETWGWMKTCGLYQGANDEAALVYCREFLTLYRALKKRINAPGYLKFIRTIWDHFKFGYPCLFKIANSEYWMIGNGHHRLACLCVLGEKFVKAKIIGVIKNPSDYKKSKKNIVEWSEV